jgi:ribonuclease HI
MTPENPHYLLFSEASQDQSTAQTWRFVLQNVESRRRFSATDAEPLAEGQEAAGHERLELLAVVRGLEALDQPARVTLVTKSRYVSRGIKHGLSDWRSSDWRWERFGRVVPVRDHDLWRRVDRALRFHRVDCQAWQFDDSAAGQEEVKDQQQVCRSEKVPQRVGPQASLKRRRRRSVLRRRPSGLLASVAATLRNPLQQTVGVAG